MNNLDYIHAIITGGSGVGKSHLAATAPTPTLIALFDSIGNARPYLRGYQNKMAREFGGIIIGQPTIINTILSYDLEDKELEKPLRKIWLFSTENPNAPLGKRQFDIKLPILQEEVEKFSAATFILDSVTSHQTQSRFDAKAYNPNPIRGDQDLAYAVTDNLEQIANILMGLRCNVLVIAHISGRIDAKGIRHTAVNAPGRMADNLMTTFSDNWHCFVDPEGDYKAQMRAKGDYNAKNTLGHTEDMPNNWQSIVQSDNDPIIWV